MTRMSLDNGSGRFERLALANESCREHEVDNWGTQQAPRRTPVGSREAGGFSRLDRLFLGNPRRRHTAFIVETLFPRESPSPEDLLIAEEEAAAQQDQLYTTDAVPNSGTFAVERDSEQHSDPQQRSKQHVA